MLSPATSDSLPSGGQIAFLRRMTHDDEFRSTLEADPQKALAEYGLHIDPQELPAVVSLPSKPAIQASLSCLENSGDDESELFRAMWMGFLGH